MNLNNVSAKEFTLEGIPSGFYHAEPSYYAHQNGKYIRYEADEEIVIDSWTTHDFSLQQAN